jgi:hypothetical protein
MRLVTEVRTVARNKLFPKPSSSFLSPAEVVSRLRAEFRHIAVDQQQGVAHAGQLIAQLERMKDLEPPPASPEEIQRLRSLQNQALFITLSDEAMSEFAYLAFGVIPGTPLFFGYSSPQHEEASRPLLERCASALDYDIE